MEIGGPRTTDREYATHHGPRCFEGNNDSRCGLSEERLQTRAG